MTVRDAQPDDVVVFRSGPRRVVARWHGGLAFVQLRDGEIGSYRNFAPGEPGYWKRTKHADGKVTTAYTWSDLARMKIIACRRGESP